MTQPYDVTVSDHALVRWIERAHGIDLDIVRQELIDKAGAAAAIGATSLIVDGVTIVMKQGIIVTVLTNEMRRRQRGIMRNPIRPDAGAP